MTKAISGADELDDLELKFADRVGADPPAFELKQPEVKPEIKPLPEPDPRIPECTDDDEWF